MTLRDFQKLRSEKLWAEFSFSMDNPVKFLFTCFSLYMCFFGSYRGARAIHFVLLQGPSANIACCHGIEAIGKEVAKKVQTMCMHHIDEHIYLERPAHIYIYIYRVLLVLR